MLIFCINTVEPAVPGKSVRYYARGFQYINIFQVQLLLQKGYHAYKDVSNPLVGDDSLVCEREERNVYAENAVAVIFDDCISKKIVGHVPFSWSKLASMFLSVHNSCIRGTVTWKRVYRGAGLRLEKPMHYTFYGDARVVLWLVGKSIQENN